MRSRRHCTCAGQPFGEREYPELLEERFQPAWRKSGFQKELHVLSFAFSMAAPRRRSIEIW